MTKPLTSDERNQIFGSISDAHKDAYGFRPRISHEDSDAMSDTKLLEWEQDVYADAERACNEEQANYDRAEAKWNTRLEELISMGAGNRSTALRWDIQAQGLMDPSDIGEYCWVLGIRFRNETAIRETL